MAHEAGKGDTYRSVDQKTFDDNFDRIFRKRILEQKTASDSLAEYELDKSTGEVVRVTK
jgi:hypothetical protein